MKKLLLTFSLVSMMEAGAFAQGFVEFENYFGSGNPNNVLVTDVFGVPIPGSSFQTDLLYGSSASTVTGDIGVAKGFGTGINAGYFLGGSQTIPLTGTVFVRIVVWQAAAGASWAAATGGAINYGSNPTTY